MKSARTRPRQTHDHSFGYSIEVDGIQRRIGCQNHHDRTIFLVIVLANGFELSPIRILAEFPAYRRTIHLQRATKICLYEDADGIAAKRIR